MLGARIARHAPAMPHSPQPRSPLRTARAAWYSVVLLLVAQPTQGVTEVTEEDSTTPSWATESSLVGSWSGAYVRSNSALPVHVRIERGEDGELVRYEEIPDWVYYGWMGPAPVTIDEQGRIVMPGQYGEARLVLDADDREMLGPCGSASPPVTLHLKRSVPPPAVRLTEGPASFASDVPLAGTLVLPEGDGPHPCVVLLHGRGCWERATSKARALARYRVAAMAYDERGTGESGGECATQTFEQRVADAEAALRFAAAHPSIDRGRIGVQGGSAGAWTAQALALDAQLADDLDPLAFIVTWNGPATSIAEQQRDAALAIGARLGFTEERNQLVLRWLELALDTEREPEQVFAELADIERIATEEGWLEQIFEPDDFPDSIEGLDRLWVRRHRFDPAEALLASGDVPYLAVFGAEDDVVPVATTVPRLRDLLTRAGNESAHIVTIPGVQHGTEHWDAFRTLTSGGQEVSYFLFEKVEPRFFECTIEFLRELGVASR